MDLLLGKDTFSFFSGDNTLLLLKKQKKYATSLWTSRSE